MPQFSSVFCLNLLVRCLATRKGGPFKLPNIPIRGPRDFDYWRRLRRTGKQKERSPRSIEHHPDSPDHFFRRPKERTVQKKFTKIKKPQNTQRI